MKLLAWLRSFASALFHRSDMEDEMDEELRSHIEQRADDLERSGLPRAEAGRRARLEFGGHQKFKEECRETRSTHFIETILQDMRFGARMLRKSPGFTAVAVLTLALGIGATTAIFSVVDAALLRSLPYAHDEQLVMVRESSHGVNQHSPSYPDFLDWRAESRTFAQMAAVNNREFNLSGIAQPESISGYAVSPNLLSLLGVRPILGRDFLPEEEKPGTAPVVLLSYRLWVSHFGGDPDAIGRSISLDGRSFTIVGVLPPSFHLPEKTDVLAPIGVWAGEDTFKDRGERGDMAALGRLAPGATLTQARAEMEGIAARLAQEYPITNSDVSATLTPLRDEFLGDMRAEILVLFGAAVFVLLIACVNVANLFLARAATRTREIALRQTFGASRGRLVRQMLTESFLLSALGGLLGILLGILGIAGLGRLLPADQFQNLNITMDRTVLIFTAAAIGFVTFAFGLVPAWQASRTEVQETLKQGGPTATSSFSHVRLRSALAIAEIALALVLLVGAGLMMQSLYRLLKVNPGFRPDRVLTMEMNLRTAQYSKPAAILNFWQQTLERVRAIPGVERAALGTVIPLSGNHDRDDITVEGMPDPGLGKYPHPDYHAVSRGYVDALGVPLLLGRDFSEADNETAPQVALINATMARRFWPNGEAIGKRFHWGDPGPHVQWVNIIGVVGDTKLYGLANPARLEVYVPYRQSATNDMSLVLRSSIDPASLTSAVRAAVAGIDKDQPVFGVTTMKQLIDDSVSTRRATLILLGLFSALALILASIGIYGVISYSVEQRTNEIGIRVALGAQRRDILRMILVQGGQMALLGIGIGIVAGQALTGIMASLLYGVSARDPLTFGGVAILIALVALAACYVPARRAMRVDPMVALRYE
ncbi:MAG: ADOP family duplicated permease [Candidatus Acidiferrales bacterium]